MKKKLKIIIILVIIFSILFFIINCLIQKAKKQNDHFDTYIEVPDDYNVYSDNLNEYGSFYNSLSEDVQDKITYAGFIKIKSMYSGNYDISTLDEYIDKLGIYTKTIYQNSKSKSYNQIRQYYDLNSSEISKYYIMDRTSYLYIAEQVLGMKWTNNPIYQIYKVNETSFKTGTDYSSVNVTMKYSTNDEINIILNIPNDTSKNSDIYITAKEPKSK